MEVSTSTSTYQDGTLCTSIVEDSFDYGVSLTALEKAFLESSDDSPDKWTIVQRKQTFQESEESMQDGSLVPS